jgi:hypothetical protein
VQTHETDHAFDAVLKSYELESPRTLRRFPVEVYDAADGGAVDVLHLRHIDEKLLGSPGHEVPNVVCERAESLEDEARLFDTHDLNISNRFDL